MGFLSKIWKGVKKVVKKAARGVKKIAKKIAYATPWGKKAWDFSSKVGKKAAKTVGKVVDAIGPVGMIALSVLAPYAAPLWSAFGAASAAAGGFWGSVGTAVYNAGNWVAGTMGSMTKGIGDAIGNLASGSFSKAGDAAVKGFADAFTGKAGKAAVEKGALKAAGKAATDAALKSAAEQAVADQASGQLGATSGPGAVGNATGQAATDATAAATQQTIQAPAYNPQGGFSGGGFMDQAPVSTNTLLSQESAYTGAQASGVSYDAATNSITGAATADVQLTGSSKGTDGLLSKAVDTAKDAMQAYTAMQSGGIGGYRPISAVGGPGLFGTRGATGEGGLGSQGGEFLTQDMKRRMAEAQARMARGFGGQYY